ncbi:hypothetical protein BESB_071750 [Besnoitia besnoiti]|uniref:Mic1 domain-containing protein n=1 Tax=Besnoitia besnoiti TaxID=94643 RepID=A0A2A9MEC6_BESBE|nr:uncharacterized protein BESB_071750 [Besnoitia besnoiti]PFH34023.1 hypothetical protein BESB_071750 [Besnoitia besnoiti]
MARAAGAPSPTSPSSLCGQGDGPSSSSLAGEHCTDLASGTGKQSAGTRVLSSSYGSGIGCLEYSAHRPPPPLTEAELRYYTALPTVYLQPPIYSWTPNSSGTSSSRPFRQQRVLFDEVHRKILHQQVGRLGASLPGALARHLDPRAKQSSPVDAASDPGALEAFSEQHVFQRPPLASRSAAPWAARSPRCPGSNTCSFLLCVDTPEKQGDSGRTVDVSSRDPVEDSADGRGLVIPFEKSLASILRFSPCGRYLLYVAAPFCPALAAAAGGGNGQSPAPASPGGVGGRGPEAGGVGAAGAETRTGDAAGADRELVEIGIVDVERARDGAVVLLPVEGTLGGAEPGQQSAEAGEAILQAFWLPSLVPAESEANICVITKQAVEIFTFVFNPPSVRRNRRLPQPCSLAWAVLCPFPSSGSSSAPTAPSSAVSPAAAARAKAGWARAVAPRARRPAVAGAFVLAVAARTLQPFLLKWNEDGRPGVTLAKLPKIELNLPQWQSLQQQEVHFLLVYGVVYCIHVDQAAGRISMRTLTGPLQPDVVLDCLQPGPMEVSVVDDLILVHHQRLRSTLIYDIFDYPSLPTVPFSVSLASALAAGGGAKSVRAVAPLVRHGVVGIGPSLSFEEAEAEGGGDDEPGEGAGRRPRPAKQDTTQLLDEVELQTVDFETARFVGGEFIMDEEGGRMYLLALNPDVLMHRLLLERQSLSFALQVMQQRSGCRRQVLRLLQHALRLRTPLSDLSPVLLLVNQRYRAAVESVPDEFLRLSEAPAAEKKRAGESSPAADSNRAAGGDSPRARARVGGRGEGGERDENAAGGSTPQRLDSKKRPPKNVEEKGKTRVALERLVAWVGDATIVTERDVVLSVLYPYVVEALDLPPGQLLLEAAFDLPAGVAASLSSSLCRQMSSHSLLSSASASFSTCAPCGCPGRFCGAVTRSPANAKRLGWRPAGSSWDSEGPASPSRPTAAGGQGGTEGTGDDAGAFFEDAGLDDASSEIPYVLRTALEYMRSLLSQQVLPHRVLQTFIFDACVFFKRGDILRQLLQYHILLDSPDIIKRLFIVWSLLRARRRRCLASARDERWIRQACLDMALRQRDWPKLVEILIQLKQYTRVVPLLRRYAVSSYPLRGLLRAVAADVQAQELQPGLLQHVLACVRAWVSDASLSASVALPNLADCNLWLPHILAMGDAPKQLPAALLQDCLARPPASPSEEESEVSGLDAAGDGSDDGKRGGSRAANADTDEEAAERRAQSEGGRGPEEATIAGDGEPPLNGDGSANVAGRRVDGQARWKRGDDNSREDDEASHVAEWEEVGEVSAIAEASDSDAEPDARALFSFEAHQHLVVTALGASDLDHTDRAT